MLDPPRPEVAPAIAVARAAGIRTIMITGDNPLTAQTIAGALRLSASGAPALHASEIDMLDEAELRARLRQTTVIARASPSHKLRIVDALRKDGEIVAMTGDGVNDAPALKQSDIGVAMGLTGTDVSKEAADMVLTDDNFASIVRALELGRVIYANIRKFVAYLLGCNAAEIAIILIATVLGWPSPLNAIQLLWLNLVTDGAPALALGIEPPESDVMRRPPRPPREPILNTRLVRTLTVQAAALSAVVLAVYAVALRLAPAQAGTLAYLALALSELPLAYASRFERRSMFARGQRAEAVPEGARGNRALDAAAALSLALILITVFVPPVAAVFGAKAVTAGQFGAVAAAALLPAMVVDGVKWLTNWRPV
jgi:Ca2+-transporting ATPase